MSNEMLNKAALIASAFHAFAKAVGMDHAHEWSTMRSTLFDEDILKVAPGVFHSRKMLEDLVKLSPRAFRDDENFRAQIQSNLSSLMQMDKTSSQAPPPA